MENEEEQVDRKNTSLYEDIDLDDYDYESQPLKEENKETKEEQQEEQAAGKPSGKKKGMNLDFGRGFAFGIIAVLLVLLVVFIVSQIRNKKVERVIRVTLPDKYCAFSSMRSMDISECLIDEGKEDFEKFLEGRLDALVIKYYYDDKLIAKDRIKRKDNHYFIENENYLKDSSSEDYKESEDKGDEFEEISEYHSMGHTFYILTVGHPDYMAIKRDGITSDPDKRVKKWALFAIPNDSDLEERDKNN